MTAARDRRLGAPREIRVVHVMGSRERGLTDGGPDVTRFMPPQELVFGADALCVADTGNHPVRTIDTESGEVTPIAGNGTIELRLASEFDARSVGMRSP